MIKLHEWPISFNNRLEKEISQVIMILNSKQCIDKIRRAFENTRDIQKTRTEGELFLECSQLSGMFYYNVIHYLGFLICFMI